MADVKTTSFQTAASSPSELATPLTKVQGHLKRMLFFRRQHDQRRSLYYRQYIGQRDAQKFPDNLTNRANTFVPYPLSNVETIVSRTSDAFFSFDPWFEADGYSPLDEPSANAMELVLRKKLHFSKCQQAIEDLTRNIAIYGHAGIKVDWDWDYDYVVKPQAIFAQNANGPIVNPMTGQPVQIGIQPVAQQVPRNRPKFTVIDVYDLMIDPDGKLVAQLTEKTLGQILREVENFKARSPLGEDLYLPEGVSKLQSAIVAATKNNPEMVVVRLAEFWDEVEQTVTICTFADDAKDVLQWKDLRYAYRGMGYTPYKRDYYNGEAILLYHGPNPFAHKRNPILHTSYIKLPNEVYGIGAIEIISDLTESLNKMVNMITDNWNLGINRRYAYNTDADIDHEALNQFNVPGGKVGVVGNPKDVIEPLPFFTPEAGDYQLLELYKGMIETASGVSDFYSKGVGSPTNNGTATGINQIINESNFRFKMFIRNIELDILQPLLEMCSSMCQQFLTDPEELQVTDEMVPSIPKWAVVTPDQLIGNIKFSLVAANYATSKIMRQRNIMAFLNIAMQTPWWNMGEGLREVGKVMEVRNINKLIKPDQQVMMEQQAQLQQQMQMMLWESMLNTESKARLSQVKPQKTTGKDGRPRTQQFEGKIPGAGLSGHIRSMAQSMGLNSMGLEGIEGGE